MAVTHFMITSLPDASKVVSQINGVAMQANILYPIADQATVKFTRASGVATSYVKTEAKYKTFDDVADVYSNVATILLEWGEASTGGTDGGTSGGSTGGSTGGTAYTMYELSRAATAADACTDYSTVTEVYYMDGTVGSGTAIWTDQAGTTYAPPGFYSDGAKVREWSGSAWTASAAMCSI